MKITDLAILFIVITLPFALILRIQSDNLQNVNYRRIVLNRYLDTAVEDAAEAMIVRGENRKVYVSREKALDAFLNTLFANFNVVDTESARSSFMIYIPVIILVDYDGYWVYSIEEYLNDDGVMEQKMVWKPKKPYTCVRGDYTYIFTLDRYVKVYNSAAGQFFEGNLQDIKAYLPNTLLQDNELFEAIRKKTIIDAIKNDVNDAINLHNTYANRFGISYRFSPPLISDGDWYRNIEDIGFLAFFQGIPMGLHGERFNSYALGASRIVRKTYYYIQEDLNGLRYYHRENCPELTEKEKVYDSREDCAMEGAFPCHTCQP